ncbi:NDP-sugar pyrophosphorylase family protein [Moryella indoligenes]|uniref:NDP-sugar pyrophosphorylase family protein n=1 Tax=Moryella indoligenes TaxID=371674 RepID=A0AAE4AL94_9FIRM|nr:UDP-N-acetylglucosamine pyrophosphorylase [Moryella indoligenes]MDQ0152905.1 NDP-sugar pyrophosphorylase family protein [Moryella indoligenes]
MKKEDLRIEALFDLNRTIAAPLFQRFSYPWELLPEIGSFLMELGQTLPESEYEKFGDCIWVHRSVKIAKTVSLKGPLIVCEGAELRQCAFVRGNVLIGRNSVAGNSCEFKNSILFDHVETPHYNYIGDSVLGYRSHMGAGAITSNIKSDRKNIVIHCGNEEIETGLRKIGGILGDGVEVGCGSVLNPGVVIGKNTTVYPLSSVRGVLPANTIYKREGELVRKR